MNRKENLEKQLCRIRISEDDFRESTEYLKIYNMQNNNCVSKALLSMAIICYSRPFVKNNDDLGKGQSILSIKIKDIYNEKEMLLHKKIIEYRNKAIAHSDYEMNQWRLLKSSLNGFDFEGYIFDIKSENIDGVMFLEMCEKIIRRNFKNLLVVNNKLNLLKFEP